MYSSFLVGGWEGRMITRSSWHICLWVLMGATAVQRGESEGKGGGGVQLQLSRDGVILSNIFETKKHVFSVLQRARQGSNTGLGCPGSQAPPKKIENSEVGLRQSWSPERSGDASKTEVALPSWQTGTAVLTPPFGISLPVCCELSAHCLRANVPWCVDEGWGLASWAWVLCAFQAGIYFNLFFRLWFAHAWLDTLSVRGVVTYCTPPWCHIGLLAHQPLCGEVWSRIASPISSSHHRTLVPLLHL